MLNPISRLVVLIVILSALVLIQGISTPVAAQGGCTFTDPASGRVIPAPCPPQPKENNPPVEEKPQLLPPKIAPVEINPNINTNTNPSDVQPKVAPINGAGEPTSLLPAIQTPLQPVLLVGLGILGLLAVLGILVINGKVGGRVIKPSVEGIPIGYNPQAEPPGYTGITDTFNTISTLQPDPEGLTGITDTFSTLQPDPEGLTGITDTFSGMN